MMNAQMDKEGNSWFKIQIVSTKLGKQWPLFETLLSVKRSIVAVSEIELTQHSRAIFDAFISTFYVISAHPCAEKAAR